MGEMYDIWILISGVILQSSLFSVYITGVHRALETSWFCAM